MPRSMRGIRAIAFALVLGGASGCREADLHPFFEQRRLPLVFAHRGGGGLMPEATLPTLLAAEARDPEAIIEFDVHRSKDGHIVVIHDETVDRTTNGSGRVDELTLAELQALDAGFCATPGDGDGTAPEGQCHGADPSGFPFRGEGFRIPTLDEVLSALRPDTAIGIEVKAEGFEEEFAAALTASGRLDRLVTGSAIDAVSVRLKDLLPDVPQYIPAEAATCFGVAAKVALDYTACPNYELFASPLERVGLRLDTEDILSAAHDEGIAVVYWTINSAEDMERLFLLGADGVFTDFPDDAREVVSRLRAEGRLP